MKTSRRDWPRSWIRGLVVASVLMFGCAWSPVHADEDLVLDPPRALMEAGASANGTPGWLSARQMADGSWSAMEWPQWCYRYPRAPEHHSQPGRAKRPHDVAVTGLTLSSLLTNGLSSRGTHAFAPVVSSGLAWLKRKQAKSGAFSVKPEPHPTEAHAIATLAMTEGFGMTGSPVYASPCRRALKHLLSLRSEAGVWTHDDTDVVDLVTTMWAASALRSADLINCDAVSRGRVAPLSSDVAAALQHVVAWLETQSDAKTPLRVAIGVLVRMLAGHDAKSSADLQAAATFLRAHPPRTASEADPGDDLYVYVGSMAAFQLGGKTWSVWKRGIEARVVESQVRDGTNCELRGTWAPRGKWSTERGRIASTALSSMVLARFYTYDRVFGSPASRKRPNTRIAVRNAPMTWKSSSQPIHAARMTLALGGALPLDAVHIQADVHGHRVQVVLDLFVTNSTERQAEGQLDLRLPTGAAPYYLAFGEAELTKLMAPGVIATDLASLRSRASGAWGRVREARMAPVDRATMAFEAIVSTKRDPALLTWEGAGVFGLRVFPLLPGKQHRIVVAYEVDLQPVGDDAELVLGLPPRVPAVHVAVRAPGVTWSASPEAPIASGTRTWHEPKVDAIRVRVAQPGDQWLVGTAPDETAYTAAWITPKLPVVERDAGSHAQFVVDVSESVSGAQMDVWRQMLPAVLDANRERIVTFSVRFFDMRARAWRAAPVPNTAKNVALLRADLAALSPGGATDLSAAFAPPSEDTDVFLFTDGARNWGPTERAAVLKVVSRDRPVFVYATGLGSEDREMLSAIARQSGGALFSVLGPADVARAVRAHRYRPWQLESVAMAGLSDVLVAGAPSAIYPAQRLRIVARGTPAPGASLDLVLRQGDRTRPLNVSARQPTRSSMAARSYGHEAVRRLEEAGATHVNLARDYAMHFRIVREHTALVMLETEADYKKHGLDETGHAGRVAASPVRATLPLVPATSEPKRIDGERSKLDFATRSKLPQALRTLLANAPLESLLVRSRGPRDEFDPILRELGGTFERAGDVYGLALYAFGRKRFADGFRLLFRSIADTSAGDETTAWLMARAAIELDQPLLVLLGFEAALGGGRSPGHGEVTWVIAADYERWLHRALAHEHPPALKRFMKARLKTLSHWRHLMGEHAPPKHAKLVVLHLPFHRRDHAEVQLKLEGVLADPDSDTGRAVGYRKIPRDARGAGPQMTLFESRPLDVWSLLVRRPSDAPFQAPRSLLLVIEDWGSGVDERTSIHIDVWGQGGSTSR